MHGHRVPAKGADPVAVKAVMHDLDSMGIKRAAYRTDQEKSIIALFEAVAREWSGELVPEEALVGDKDSNALAEAAVKVHEGLVRTYKIALESRIGTRIDDNAGIMAWIIEWATTMHRRSKIGTDGKSAHERIHGRCARQAHAEFGERVLAQPLTSNGRANTDDRFAEGIFIGLRDRSDEHLIFDGRDIFRARSIIRRRVAQ